MTGDERFARRVIRLALTSVFALGFILLLWAMTLDTHVAVGIGLAAGWVLMPSILTLSLRWPVLRHGLIIPSSLVGLALLAICIGALPEDQGARTGWLLITGGVLFGGVLGAWFWLRWLPVPVGLHNPFSFGRWALVGAHVFLVAAGLVLVTISVLT